jgi:Arc/MetJ-type ribon-helix-helix transcriptional regulator
MGKRKIIIILDEQSLNELDKLVKDNKYQNRSQAIQEAVSEKLQRVKKTRLAVESARLNPEFERELAEERFMADGKFVITPVPKPKPSLKPLLLEITDDNLHKEIDTGFTIGNETW